MKVYTLIIALLLMIVPQLSQAAAFGYLSIGGTSGGLSNGFYRANQYTTSEGGTLATLRIYAKAISLPFDLTTAVYSDNGSDQAGAKFDEDDGNVTVNTTAQWWTFTGFSGTFSASTKLWLAWFPANGTQELIYYDNTSYLRNSGSGTFSTWPDPFTFSTSGNDNRYSIYATYTASGGDSTTTPNNAGILIFE